MSTRGPETEKQGGAFGNGSRNGLGGFVGRASSLLEECQLLHLGRGENASTYDHGVQTSTGEARGADEVLGRLEEGLEVGLQSDSNAIRLGRAIVEALVDGGGGGERSREGEKVGRTHCAVSPRANVVG